MAPLSLLDILAIQRNEDNKLYQTTVGDITGLVNASVIISPDPPYYVDAYGNEVGERPDDGQLWFDSSEDSLTLFVWMNQGSGSWVPAAPPVATDIQNVEVGLSSLEQELYKTTLTIRENENRIGRTIYHSDAPPQIYADEFYTYPIYDVDGVTQIGEGVTYTPNELNYKFWFDTSRLELLILFKDEDGDYSYVPSAVPLTDIDLDALNAQVQSNSYNSNQQSQAIELLEQLIFERATIQYVDNSTSTFETAIKASGFNLGSFKYRRGSDDFPSGAIQSNTTTNPENIFELKIWNKNADGIEFGNEFYEKFITEKMYVHIRDKSACSYVGRIDGIEMITNGIKLTLMPITGEVSGSIYYNNRYEVSIGYNKYGVKYPE